MDDICGQHKNPTSWSWLRFRSQIIDDADEVEDQENKICRTSHTIISHIYIINSSASAQLNAMKIAVKKVSDVDVCMFGPEL